MLEKYRTLTVLSIAQGSLHVCISESTLANFYFLDCRGSLAHWGVCSPLVNVYV